MHMELGYKHKAGTVHMHIKTRPPSKGDMYMHLYKRVHSHRAACIHTHPYAIMKKRHTYTFKLTAMARGHLFVLCIADPLVATAV